jgi:hypothetical protein
MGWEAGLLGRVKRFWFIFEGGEGGHMQREKCVERLLGVNECVAEEGTRYVDIKI